MNGIAERGNQTVYNAGYAILLSANLPESFWVQAISYAVIIYNFFPLTPSQDASSLSKAGLVGQGASRGFESGGALPTFIFRLIFGT
jgi:hypothetical protein